MSEKYVFDREELAQWTEANKAAMVEELKKWVSHPSVSREDLGKPGAPYGPDVRAMLDFALERGKAYGFEAKDFEGYAGSIYYGDGDSELGIIAHMDVVPEGSGWIFEPYNPVEKDGWLIGRGVGDNKGPGVAGLYVLKYLKDHGIKTKHKIRLILGTSEETGMQDMKEYVKRGLGPIPTLTLVADAGFPVCFAQKGGLNATGRFSGGKDLVDFEAGSVRNAVPDAATLKIKNLTAAKAAELIGDTSDFDITEEGGIVTIIARGRAGHAASPQNSDNAITKAARAAEKLAAAGVDLGAIPAVGRLFTDYNGGSCGLGVEDEVSGKLTINAGVVHTKDGICTLELDSRYPISFKGDELAKSLEEKMNAEGIELAAFGGSDPFYIDPQSPAVTTLMGVYRDITGDETPAYAIGGGTYSKALPNAVTFGPSFRSGKKPEFLPEGHGNAHGRDEALNIEDWMTGFRIYVESIIKLDAILD
jgi:succinyl-diaminopimelate desuccinylase